MKEYRGKRKDNGVMIYGDKVEIGNQCWIVPHPELSESDDMTECHCSIWGFIEVIPKTVGQCTRFKDKGGVEIYEGDIVQMPFYWRYKDSGIDYEEEGYYEGEVVIIASAGVTIRNPIRYKYNLTNDTPKESAKLKQYRRLSAYITKIIGNIHDNPELYIPR